jgi:hypothetical protein
MKKVAMTVFGVLALAASANEVPTLGTWQTSLTTWRSLFPKRLIGLLTSPLLITFIAAAAHADDVLTLGARTDFSVGSNSTVISSYTFNSSMILNSIGFVTGSSVEYAYSINTGAYINVATTSMQPLALGVRYLNLATPITLNATNVVRIRTKNTQFFNPKVPLYGFTAVSGFDITVVGNNRGQGAKTNSNLRVSALGASVAPEPGTLALALTGGFALVGICIRRRRMSN